MSTPKKLPAPHILAADIAAGMLIKDIKQKYDLLTASSLFRYLKNHNIPFPLDYAPKPPAAVAHVDEPYEVNVRRGPQPDERRVVVNGISLPRIKTLHGEFVA